MLKRPKFVISAYVILLCVLLLVHHRFPEYREYLRFWIPQILLFMMITVTTLYVMYTAELVEETRRLQQRPLIQLSFCEIPEASPVRFDRLFKHGQDMFMGVAKLIGGEEMQRQTRYLAIELKNIGQIPARDVTARLNMVAPTGSLIEEKEFAANIGRDETIRITVAPSSVPWIAVEVQSLSYGDGLRKHTEFVGERVFSTSPAVPGAPGAEGGM